MTDNSSRINYLKRVNGWCELTIIFYESNPE